MLFMRLGAFPVGFSYYLCSKKAREESRRFLLRAAAILGTAERQFPIRILKHILAFSLTVVEKVEAWGGKVDFSRIHFLDDDIGELITNLENGSGALLICSHLGNTELLRGLASFNRTGVSRKLQVTSIVDFSVNPYFNRMLRELNPQSALRVITTDNFGPDTIILLQERLTQGDLVVITGDRTSPNTRYKYFLLPFLNEKAPFGYGPFFLASVLNVPTYFVFALRQKDVSLSSEYNMYVHRSPVSFDCSRKEREQRTRELARSFAEYLERYCKQYPYQWYNFYDFWAKPAGDSEIPPPEQQKRNPVPARPEVQDGSPYSKCGN
jgi:predicted LPLAT superfamily acyltransferase